MKRKELLGKLGTLLDFTKPNILLEQYMTRPELTATVLHEIQLQNANLHNAMVADLGCGTGNLAIGASLLGAAECVGFEVDADALSICSSNLKQLEIDNIQLVQCDVTRSDVLSKWHGIFDIVIMNPPFGTKRNEGIDVAFLECALNICGGTIYSFHKTSTRKYMLNKAKSLHAKGTVLAELRFDLPSTYRCHKKDCLDIKVDLYQFTRV